MTEQERFNLYLEDSRQRRTKYENNLHKDCTACRVGLKWTEQEDITLIKTLTACTFNRQLSKCMDRPIWGLVSRLKKLGLVHNSSGVYRTSYSVYRPTVKSDNILSTLKDIGWYNNPNSTKTNSPLWWIQTCIKTGKQNGTL